MIDPKELRIGNLILYDRICMSPDIVVVDAVDKEMISGTGESHYMLPCKNFSAAPITLWWLEKLGFKVFTSKAKYGTTYYKGRMFLHLRKRGWVITAKFRTVDSIHQLQNLYHSLTGQELQIQQEANAQ